jgi:hypothetical protein
MGKHHKHKDKKEKKEKHHHHHRHHDKTKTKQKGAGFSSDEFEEIVSVISPKERKEVVTLNNELGKIERVEKNFNALGDYLSTKQERVLGPTLPQEQDKLFLQAEDEDNDEVSIALFFD